MILYHIGSFISIFLQKFSIENAKTVRNEFHTVLICFVVFLLALNCTECNALNNILGKEEVYNDNRND